MFAGRAKDYCRRASVKGIEVNKPLKPGDLAYQPSSAWTWVLRDDGLLGERIPWDQTVIFMIIGEHQFDTDWFVCLAGERLVVCHPADLARLV